MTGDVTRKSENSKFKSENSKVKIQKWKVESENYNGALWNKRAFCLQL